MYEQYMMERREIVVASVLGVLDLAVNKVVLIL